MRRPTRRLSVFSAFSKRLAVWALVALATAILALAADSAEARARRKKATRRARPAAAASSTRATSRTSTPDSVPATTPPDVIPRRLLVLGFGGKGAQAARSATLAALRKTPSLVVVPLRPSDALKIGTNYGAQKTVGLARRLNLTAVLYGEVTQERGKVHLALSLANGEDARIVGEIELEARTLGALRAKIRTELWPQLGPLIDQSASPGPVETARKPPEETPEEAPAPPKVKKAPAPEAVRPTPPEPERRAPKPKAAPKPPTRGTPDQETPAGEAPEGEAPEGEPKPEPEHAEELVPEVRPHNATPARKPPEEAEDEGEGEAPGAAPVRCSIADLEPGGGVMFRRFNYRDEQRGALRGYTLYRAPVGRIEGTVYPFARRGHCPMLAGLGLRLAYERMGAVTSTLANRRLTTSASAYQAEVVLRLTRGRFTIEPALGYFVRQYSVESGVVPSADYRAVGASVDAGVRVRFITFELGAGARRLLGAGTLQDADWFPGLSTFALAGRARLGLAVTDWIDILAGVYAEYDSFNFNIKPGAAYPNGVAAGAFDLYLQGLLSARFRFGVR